MFGFLFASFVAHPSRDTITNAINNKILINTDQSEFSFLVAGHAYGFPGRSIYPCPSLTANVDKFNSTSTSFFMLLGDNYRQLKDLNISAFKSTFLDKIEIPVFNAVGNHDLTQNLENDYKGQNYSLYKKLFGQDTYYSFVINTSAFIILDSEHYLDDEVPYGNIKDEQLIFLKETLDQLLSSNSSIQRIFICAHKQLQLFEENNYEKEIKPLFSKATPAGIEIFMLSGDMNLSNDLYVTKEVDPKITYVHTNLADNINDKILQINVTSNGSVEIIPISLTGQAVKNINEYVCNLNPVPLGKPTFVEIFYKYHFTNILFLEGMLFLSVSLLLLFGFWRTIRFFRRSHRRIEEADKASNAKQRK